MTEPPAWIESLVDTVARCMAPHNVLGPLGYWWSEEDGFWEVMVYPSAAELVGGMDDGAVVTPSFSLDLRELNAAFEHVTKVHWQSHALGPHDQAGPHVCIEGRIGGQQILLQVMSEAPMGEGPGFRVDVSGNGGFQKGIEAD